MVASLFDTNILIDFLNDIPQARAELGKSQHRLISVITWIEVLVGADPGDERTIRKFLGNFEVLGLDDDVAQRAILLRRQHRLKLPDALIWATAQSHSAVLVTRNTRDFRDELPSIRIPYRLS